MTVVRPNPTSRHLTKCGDLKGTIPGNADGLHAQRVQPEGPEDFDDMPVPLRTGECRDLTELISGSGADDVFRRR